MNKHAYLTRRATGLILAANQVMPVMLLLERCHAGAWEMQNTVACCGGLIVKVYGMGEVWGGAG